MCSLTTCGERFGSIRECLAHVEDHRQSGEEGEEAGDIGQQARAAREASVICVSAAVDGGILDGVATPRDCERPAAYPSQPKTPLT